jgi:catechol 2,3-dioxygenase-like lactoylglutathione lyase family enzyme
MNLNQVTLPVSHVQNAVDFYLTLGFTQIVDSPHYARFACPDNGGSFSLILDESDFMNSAVIYFEHEHLDDWVDGLIAKGVDFAQLPTDMSYLWREAICYDPSGNKIKLYWAGENRLSPPWKVNITNNK